MRAQTIAAVRDADAALFLIDARAGVTPLDEEIARWLRSEETPVILAANKAEGRAGESGLLEAYSLGLGDPIGISAERFLSGGYFARCDSISAMISGGNSATSFVFTT
jgi:GTP-binding protein